MRKRIKKILASIGLLNIAKKIRYRIYQHKKQWQLNFGDLNVIYDTTDSYSNRWFYPRYAHGGIHEPGATKIFMDNIEKHSKILDIGGHLGYFTCIAGKLAAKGSVYVFEVDPKCLHLINKNLRANNLTNVVVNNLAVSDKNETIKIQQYESPNPGLVINNNSGDNFIEVKSIRIDDFISQNKIKPDFIKIDVEGAEWNVLNGMKHFLAQDNNVVLLIEIHTKHLRQYFNADYSDCIDLLLKNGFRLKKVDHRLADGSFLNVDRKTILEGNTMLLCEKHNQTMIRPTSNE
ncbi:MAG: FkbM family methyltransferase [Flavobacteriaceae bacterium]|nr:FkbM family methyltransferase [Flavobacteriaceae bacterium]